MLRDSIGRKFPPPKLASLVDYGTFSYIVTIHAYSRVGGSARSRKPPWSRGLQNSTIRGDTSRCDGESLERVLVSYHGSSAETSKAVAVYEY